MNEKNSNINKQLTKCQVIKNIYEARYIGSETSEERTAVETILDAARTVLEEKFKISVNPETLSIIYQTMFIESYRFLADKLGEVKAIDLGDSCRIGITNSRTDITELDNETIGNLVPTLEDLRGSTNNNDIEKTIEDSKNRNASSAYLAELYVDALPSPEIFTIIESRCVEVLMEKYSICIPFSHILIVMWKTVYDATCAYISTQAANSDDGEYVLSFQGLIESHAKVQDDGSIKIIHYPERCIKLTTKNDVNAENEFMDNFSEVLMIKHKGNSMYDERLEELPDYDEKE